mgnify:CR=1 FL=1
MISEFEDRQYGIAEVSHMTGVPAYVLRQWEDRFPQLKPGRDRARRRIYKPADIEIARRGTSSIVANQPSPSCCRRPPGGRIRARRATSTTGPC